MGMFSFIREAGEKLFGAVSTTAKAAPAGTTPPPNIAALNKTAGDAIATYVRSQGLNADNLQISFDGASHTVTVSGQAADQATKEKILVAAGNVQHVDKVDDRLTVLNPTPVSQFHTMVSGDNLWKIADKYYGNGAKNDMIFEANKPMLKSPDKIYPGQVLRIPAVA
ncbi:peptidoglycan-binding protein LysM [Caballeronia sp. SEWSISQ10-4 2]|uniref:peptidoglycan-binding protein LysM n=1 Tax=Caballeronia sp. SEWSISQ10-4 2 TaxID=2937438 RepID=UPI00264C3623|nr:peptidoglycan-binding protein LysM [Caballeronia sp. SEWSISQ10-4 2]MDN7181110.1 peptidoglycan-binding protein LysM [Caballeronia sp. SEWSISQ10-4 2]